MPDKSPLPEAKVPSRVACLAALATAWIAGHVYRPRQVQRVQLPVAMEAALKSYLYSAFPTAIIGTRGPLNGPMVNYQLQLFFPDAKLTPAGVNNQVRFLPGMGVWHYAILGYMTVRPWTAKEFEGARRDLIGRMVATLQRGHYLRAFVNEFFVPRSIRFLKQHYRHDILLTGYEPKQNAFLQASFQNDGNFGTTLIPAGVLLQSLRMAKYGLASGPRTPVLEELSLASRFPTDMDGSIIRRQLRRYLEGKPNLAEYRPGRVHAVRGFPGLSATEEPGLFGISVYQHYRTFLNRALGGELSMDFRVTRVLMEHKQMVQLALNHLGRDTGNLIPAREYAAVVAMAQRLHLTAYGLVRDRAPRGVAVCRKLIDELEATERTVLSQALGVGFN